MMFLKIIHIFAVQGGRETLLEGYNTEFFFIPSEQKMQQLIGGYSVLQTLGPTSTLPSWISSVPKKTELLCTSSWKLFQTDGFPLLRVSGSLSPSFLPTYLLETFSPYWSSELPSKGVSKGPSTSWYALTRPELFNTFSNVNLFWVTMNGSPARAHNLQNKLCQQRFLLCHENGLIKTIQTIPQNLCVSFKSAFIYYSILVYACGVLFEFTWQAPFHGRDKIFADWV